MKFVTKDMKNRSLFTLLVMLVLFPSLKAQQVGMSEIFSRHFQRSMISKGDNVPDFKIRKDSMDFFLIALHKNIPIKEFEIRTGFDSRKIDSIIAFLSSKNWLHKIDNHYKPTIFIAIKEDGEKLYSSAKPISKQIVKRIAKMLPKIQQQFAETEIAKTQSFEEWSFFLLSDVLLDNWQIFNVENKFLGTNSRPLRHGKYYYASIEEITASTEGFGIYGNQVGEISVYGNNRINKQYSDTKHIISSSKDYQILNEISIAFLPELVQVLEKNRRYCQKVYEKLGYSKEITFEEFFIWWYHFIYTQSTNLMGEKKMLYIPNDGNFPYKQE